MKIIALIPSGGRGTRIGESLPKQYHLINGKELISYTVNIFQKCELIDEIIIPAQKEYFQLLEEMKLKNHFTKLQKIVEGGAERQDSVYNALMAANAAQDDLIVIHDAARPLLSQGILFDAINSAKIFDNVLVSVSARDTLVKGNSSVHSYIDRKGVFYAQTPQIFRCRVIKDSLEKAMKDNFYGTDESMLAVRAGYNVQIVEGSLLNFKITTKDDLDLFTSLVKIL